MDPIAHTLTGAALAASGLRRATPLATAALVIGANAPDVDAVTMFAGNFASLAFRRGWTHGVLALVVLPFVVAGGVLAFDRWIRRRRAPGEPAARAGPLLGLSVVAVLSHPALDWLNNYGMRWLMPFDGRWFYGDALFIVDPWVWLALGGVLFLGHSRSRAALAGWAGLAAFGSLLLLAAPVPAWTRLLWIGGLAAFAAARAVQRPRGIDGEAAVRRGNPALDGEAALRGGNPALDGEAVLRRGNPAPGGEAALRRGNPALGGEAALRSGNPAAAHAARHERAARAALALVAVYMGLAALANLPARAEVRESLNAAGVGPIESMMIGPVPADPFAATVVAETAGAYYTGRWHWLETPRFQPLPEPIEKRDTEPAAAAARRTLAARRFLTWSRFPYFVIEPQQDATTVVRIRDARYDGVGRLGGPVVRLDEALTPIEVR